MFSLSERFKNTPRRPVRNELERMLLVYQEQNRILRESNIKLERALTTISNSSFHQKPKTDWQEINGSTAEEAHILLDEKGTILDVNKNSLELFALSKKRIIGRSISSLFAIDQRRCLAANIKSAFAAGSSSCELRLHRADGNTFYVAVNIELTQDGRRLLQTKVRDVSSLVTTKERVEQARVYSTLGEMMCGIAHEVNNPLGTILLYSELLMQNMEPQQAQRDLKIIHGEAKRAVRILSDLLTYTQKTDRLNRKVDINRLIRRTVRMRRYPHKVANIIDVLLLSNGPLYIKGNSAQLTQVLTNILLNAEEVLKRRYGGNITITTFAQGLNAVIKVEDDGTGIPHENLEKIFYPFYSTKNIGAGLGLSTCYGIVTSLNGTMYAENNKQGGATIVIELPLWRSSENALM